MEKYKIVRHYSSGRRRTIKSGLFLFEAQAHCQDPQSSSRTATTKAARNRSRFHGAWFDGYERIGR